MTSTNLNQVKRISQLLLRVEVQKTIFSPAIVQHPFTSSGLTVLPGTYEIIDITASDENLTKWQNTMDKAISAANSVYAIYAMLNKPYALTFLKYVNTALSAEDMSAILADAWISTESPNMDVDVSKGELVAMFKQADRKHLMSNEERTLLSQLGETVTVYRGVTTYNATNIRALSWTIDRKKAEWFAHRFNEKGTVYQAQVRKPNVLAVFTSRGESEIVLNPKGLMQLKIAEG